MNNTLTKPVFIVCLHRTGSTFLKNILNQNPEIAMATDEMEISNPWRKTFDQRYGNIRKQRPDDFARKLVKTVYEDASCIRGTFWKDYPSLGIPPQKIYSQLKESDQSLKTFLNILLNEYAKLQGKKRIGVKYPLHFSKAKQLKDWFPDCKIVFLFRDARAVCASKVYDEATTARKKKAGFLWFVVHYLTLGFFIFEYIWYARIYNKHKKGLSLFPVCYEDLVSNPEYEIKKICRNCEIPFDTKMLSAEGKPSSHDGKRYCGADKTRLETWKNRLTPWDIKLINVLTRKSMILLGYSSRLL